MKASAVAGGSRGGGGGPGPQAGTCRAVRAEACEQCHGGCLVQGGQSYCISWRYAQAPAGIVKCMQSDTYHLYTWPVLWMMELWRLITISSCGHDCGSLTFGSPEYTAKLQSRYAFLLLYWGAPSKLCCVSAFIMIMSDVMKYLILQSWRMMLLRPTHGQSVNSITRCAGHWQVTGR